MHTGRTPYEYKGRDQGDMSTSQGMPKIAANSQKPRRETWMRFFLTASRGSQPCSHLNLRFLASGTVR